MAKYGIPYMGSKAKIAETILKALPPADNFYDLFGGGFSISHCALVKFKKWKHVHYNELNKDIVELVNKAINGEYNYNVFKPAWISREDFARLKDSDAYIRACWSFANNQKTYLFGKDIEQYKKSMHMAVVFNEFDDLAKKTLGLDRFSDKFNDITKRRLYLRSQVKKQAHKQLEQLERLQRLQQLQQLELTTSHKSYEQVEIKPNSVVYCDIPYKGTASYLHEFDHTKFFDWAHNLNHPVFISEYNVDDLRFKKIADISKMSLMSSTSREDKHELLYANKLGVELVYEALKNKGLQNV